MSQSHQIPDDVAQAYQHITTLFGPSFTITDVIRYIEAIRHQEIRIEQRPMPMDISGYCLPLRDMDLVCIRHGLDQQRTVAACLHELAHLLLGHIICYKDVTNRPSYAELHEYGHHHRLLDLDGLPRSVYDSTYEVAAETLATLLITGIQRHTHTPPHLARLAYGDEG